MADVGGAERLAFQGAEHGRAAGEAKLAPALEPELEQRERVVVHPDDPLAIALAVAYVELSGVWVEVAQLECERF